MFLLSCRVRGRFRVVDVELQRRRRAALPAGAALETLLALELRGIVHQLPGKRFRRRAA